MNRFKKFGNLASKNNTKACFVLKCDIRKFFANIDHNILKKILSKRLFDTDILWLLGQVIDSFNSRVYLNHDTNSAMAESVSLAGLPLGNLTSQLLVNIYMNEFDQFVKRELEIKYYIRYADDFVVLSQDKRYLQNILEKMKKFLEDRLKLSMHPNKVFIKTIASGIDFLGWVYFPKHRVLRTSTKRRMLKNIHNSPRPETVQSYLGMLKHGNAKKLEKILEQV